MHALLKSLDANQRKAVLHTNGPMLVLAGAGSGKTRVLTTRIARLNKEKHCGPENILAVTFTNKAAREMQERIASLTSTKIAQAMTVSTFHSFGARIIREYGECIGMKNHFSILGDSERLSTLKSIMRSTSTTLSKENPADFGGKISLAKNASLTPEEFCEKNPDDRKTQRVYTSYRAMMHKRQAVDFDDLLLLPLQMFQSHPEVLENYRKRYTYISVDEFQDTNVVQLRLSMLLAAPRNNIMVVGDDDQGIYSWRGADIDNIISFSSRFKGCKTVILDRNYRSTPEIVLGAMGVIARNEKRKPKDIRAMGKSGIPIQTYKADDEQDEIQWVVSVIRDNQEKNRFTYKEHALLFRTNAQMARFEEEFRIQRMPYTVQGGMSFFERKEVKDVLAYLRFFANIHDELSLMRMLKVPDRGITKTTIEGLERLAGMRNIPLWKAFERHDAVDGLSAGQREKLAAVVDFYHTYAAGFNAGNLSQTLRAMLDALQYRTLVERAYHDEPSLPMRLENIDEIMHTLALYEKRNKQRKPSLHHYLQECALLSNDDSTDESKQKGVRIMTLHKSKGLEFPVVMLPLLDDAIFPSPQSCDEGRIEEERRLFYVGMTRARKQLYLTCPRTRLIHKKNHDVKPCRFIFEIPEEYMDGKFGGREDDEFKKDSADFFAEMKKKFAAAG